MLTIKIVIKVVFSNDNILHDSPRDTVNTIICPKQSDASLFKWKIVLQQCVNCPKYNVPVYESREGRLICDFCDTEKIKCKILSRKMLTLKKLTIDKFMYDFYLPSLEKYIYHADNVQILSKIFVQNFDMNLATLNLEM